MRQDAVQAVRPHRAIAAALPHVMDQQQLVPPSEQFKQGDFAMFGGKAVIGNLVPGVASLQTFKFPDEIENLLLKFFNAFA